MIKRFICKIIFLEGTKGRLKWMSDTMYLKAIYYAIFKKKLDIDHPTTYNEKLQWLKINDRRPDYTVMVDKYAVKEYVAKRIGEQYIIKTLGVWNSFDDIDFSKLPEHFVLKCTHDSGGLVFCKDKKDLDVSAARAKINSHLNQNFYYAWREWPYKNVRPRIIAEEYMVDDSDPDLKDYKFLVFDGQVKALFVASDRQSASETCFDFYDREFNHINLKHGHPNSKKLIKKPINYEVMIDLAEKLGKGIPHCRVDLYNIQGKIYFGEITFYHFSGFVPFDPPEWDEIFGAYLKITN